MVRPSPRTPPSAKERLLQPKSAMKLAMRHESSPPPPSNIRPPGPETARPEPREVTPPPTEKVEPHGPIDLTLHGLPPGSERPPSPSETQPAEGSRGTSGGHGPWKPRGDAGDPVLGKVVDVKEDEFPLQRVGRNEYHYNGKAFSAHIAADGRVSFDNK